ncbi:nucleoid-associated protein [Aquihabitans sp. G128]|uniref:nucleoid-associated protein n=1 Tax=Aquihabitans sp. G128 TaxID=2849779 RepID=UPI001C247D21|nr:nucleoid-associated protein [Aquihabitans sp. G128]QXC60780.1 nucleoid-associated protein [Aquihabitans sp. G128]
MDLETYWIESAIVHYVPRGNSQDDTIALADAPLGLTDDLRSYFHRKIVESIDRSGVAVVADPDGDPVVRSMVEGITSDPARFVSCSQVLAQRLNVVQSARNSAGLLTVIRGSIDDVACCSILKLEREQGLRFVVDDRDGQTVVDVELLKNLTLTDKTKVFKTSILLCPTAGEEHVRGRVSDDQRGEGGVAQFFLSGFLGCALEENPAVVTMAFARAFQTFLDRDVPNVETKGRYQVALLAALQDQSAEVRPGSF